jgi:hypothetical protein
MGCQPENRQDKQLFEKNTRACFKSLMLYTASVDTAWAALPNHERISELSFRILQAPTLLV